MTLGLGLEYEKSTKAINQYIKGNTGLELSFGIEAQALFSASIGPFSANINVTTILDDAGPPLSIMFGLEDSLNYMISSNKTLERPGFVVSTVKGVVNELDVAVKGQIVSTIDATILGGFGSFWVDMRVSDINSKFLLLTHKAAILQFLITLILVAQISYRVNREPYHCTMMQILRCRRCP